MSGRIETAGVALQATKGKQVKAFYTMPEYEQWCESANTSGWKIKYYKGLGTSTSQEAREYFSNINLHRKAFTWSGELRSSAQQCATRARSRSEAVGWGPQATKTGTPWSWPSQRSARRIARPGCRALSPVLSWTTTPPPSATAIS